MLLASMIHFGVRDGAVSLHEVLIAVFVFLTAPVSGHLLAKAALHLAGQSVESGAGVQLRWTRSRTRGLRNGLSN